MKNRQETLSLLPEPSTEDLVVLARGGSEQAVRDLVRRFNPRLFRIARGLADSDAEAEEIVQETYLSAFAKLHQFQGHAQFSTWLTRIAMNVGAMRRRKTRPTEEYDTVTETRETGNIVDFPAPESAEASLGRRQLRRVLEDCVADLPADLRLVFLLREAEGLSVAEVARDLKLNPITVKTRLFRARLHLRSALERQVRGGFDAIFPFDGARCAHMADRVIAGLKGRGQS